MPREWTRPDPDGTGISRRRPHGSPERGPAAPERADSDVPERSPVRVMIVDDDSIFLMGVARMLRGAPCVIDLVDTPEEALVRLSETPPALMLIDMHMPRMNGLEFLERARLAFASATGTPESFGPGTLIEHVYLQSAGRASPKTKAEAARLGAELIDKGTVLSQGWLRGAVERIEARRSPPASGSTGKVA